MPNAASGVNLTLTDGSAAVHGRRRNAPSHRPRRKGGRKRGCSMKTILAAAVVAVTLAGGSASAATVEAPPSGGSVFADLAAFGYDLGKFRPDYDGRFPYRRT
jgi:hypothetical protein